jgi:hypothetical protein
MRLLIAVFCVGALMFATAAEAQPPGKVKKESQGGSENPDLVTYMMSFNKKKDGKLTREELTDRRLLRLFERADTNKEGFVTREQLQALVAQLNTEAQAGSRAGGGGDRGGPDRDGPAGKKGKGGPPRPGQILPPVVQEMLQLTESQKRQLADLQKEVDEKLEKILTPEQKGRLKEMRERGPGGPGGPGDKKAGPGGSTGPKGEARGPVVAPDASGASTAFSFRGARHTARNCLCWHGLARQPAESCACRTS